MFSCGRVNYRPDPVGIMKVLIVSPISTHPVSSGNRIRILRMAEVLGELGHEVHFLLLKGTDDQVAAAEAYWGSRFHRIIGSRRSAGDLLRSVWYNIERRFYRFEESVADRFGWQLEDRIDARFHLCLLYTSDAADE